MIEKWLQIIGIGEEGFDALHPKAQQKIHDADYIIGGKRHLNMLPKTIAAHQQTWLSPLKETITLIKNHAGKPTIILASGDPMEFGIGTTLAQHFSDDEMTITPWVSSFSLALAHLQWARHQTQCLTLHGRALNIVNPYLQPNQKLLVLAHDGDSPKQLADYLTAHGFANSKFYVLSHLGHDTQENISDFIANQPPEKAFPDLSVIAVILDSNPEQNWHSTQAGLPDDCYQHGGKITKAEARAAALSKLKPSQNACLWDLGAGVGSIAIEWARAGGDAIAIEQDTRQLVDLHHNIMQWGNDKITLIEDDFNNILDELPNPDAIFIGGGITLSLLQNCFQRLKQGGRMVVHAVTLESQQILLNFVNEGGHLDKITIARMQKIGNFHGFKPLMEVMQFSRIKH